MTKRRSSKKQKVDQQDEAPSKKQRKESKPAHTELQEEPQSKAHDDRETIDDGGDELIQHDGSVEQEEAVPVTPVESDGRYRNKQRCLVLCSRGVTARYRHLLEDLRTLLPHHKKESKLDPGSEGAARAVNDIAEIRGCSSVLFLECRKRQDAYLWMGKQPSGPSVRFHVSNIHTMDELRLTGNCMKGSRPVLSFDESFGRLDHLKILKELFVDTFGTPRGHPKSKPFVDRVMAFYYADNKVSENDVEPDKIGIVNDYDMMSVYLTAFGGMRTKHHLTTMG
jgi:ribosome biogenesis protein BRX1